MIICLDCGKTFELEEAQTDSQAVGVIGLETAYEEFKTCPHCDSLYIEEAKQCKACGEWKADCDMIEGVCEKCLRDSINFKNVMKVCMHMARDDEEVNKLALHILGLDFINGMIENFVEMNRRDKLSQYMLTKWVMNKENRDIREKMAEMIEEGSI